MPLRGSSVTVVTDSGSVEISNVCVMEDLATPPTSATMAKWAVCIGETTATCSQVRENWYRETGCGKNTECDKVM